MRQPATKGAAQPTKIRVAGVFGSHRRGCPAVAWALLAGAFASPLPAVAADETAESWRFEATPYLWATGLDGTLAINKITRTAGTNTFNFNGGTLQARQNDTAFVTGLSAMNVNSAGAIIDTNTFDVTIAGNPKQRSVERSGAGEVTFR